MLAFLQQMPALVGVIVGALGSYLAVRFGDRERFHREQVARWDDRRLNAYANYSQSLKATVSFTVRVSAYLGNDPHPLPLTPDEASARLGEAYEARDIAWEALLLLGNRHVVQAAREWFSTVSKVETFVRNQTCDPDEWSTLLHHQRVARAKFYAAARHDLAMPSGDESL